MIERLLSKPDMTLPNPMYRSAAPMRLYRRERVDTVEATEEFARLRDLAARRAERSKSVAIRRSAALVEHARSYSPSMPATLNYGSLTKHAIRSYNAKRLHEEGVASQASDASFLARIAWNHFRHHLTDWDATWEGFSGKPGVREAYLAAAAALTNHVGTRFPKLHDAACSWLERKRNPTLPAPPTVT